MGLSSFLMIASDIVAVALIAVVMIQGQTSAGLGSMFGGSDIYRSRRGMEKTLYQATFLLGGLYAILALLSVGLA
ncbi:MAG: preprotein translocase subunit SecG [Caldilineaceae bacterium]|jgi:preprotein translocase subunit SecG